MRIYDGKLTAEGLRFGLVVGRFNSLITERLLSGASECLLRHGAKESDLEVTFVPGSWEIPLGARWMADTGRFHAILALGCLVRGDTPHFDYIASQVASGLARVSLDVKTPVSFGVLTTETIEQAIDRAGTKHGNKGWEAALAALEMANLKGSMG